MDTFLTDHVYSLAHWPFMAWTIIAAAIGQVMKTAVWTKKRAHTKGKAQWLFWWAYKTLPLHPILGGAILGLIWQNPEHADPAWSWIASVVYFATAGALSVSLYQVVKGIAKKKGFDFSEKKPPPPSK